MLIRMRRRTRGGTATKLKRMRATTEGARWRRALVMLLKVDMELFGTEKKLYNVL